MIGIDYEIVTAFQTCFPKLQAMNVEEQRPRLAERERELNALVYELYGLTDDTVEGVPVNSGDLVGSVVHVCR